MTPVCRFVARILAPGTTAPVASRHDPEILPVLICAQLQVTSRKNNTIRSPLNLMVSSFLGKSYNTVSIVVQGITVISTQ
jgi:hypothetical protein